MKIAIIGVGGVGGYFGGLLAKNGENVTFVTRGDQYQAIKKNGLKVESVNENFHLPNVNVTNSPEHLQKPDLILITTKTYDLPDVAKKLKKNINKDTTIITLQNGLNSDLVIKQIIPAAKVVPGIAYIVSEKFDHYKIKQTAGPCTLIFGDRNKSSQNYLKTIEQLLKKCEIKVNLVNNIEISLWEKFLWITTFAGMTSLCQSSIGHIVNNQHTYQLYLDCLKEGLKVAKAAGIQIKDETELKIIKKSEDYKTKGSHAKSSMLIDIEKNRKTEIEALNGYLVKKAWELSVNVPIHRCIVAVVKKGQL